MSCTEAKWFRAGTLEPSSGIQSLALMAVVDLGDVIYPCCISVFSSTRHGE